MWRCEREERRPCRREPPTPDEMTGVPTWSRDRKTVQLPTWKHRRGRSSHELVCRSDRQLDARVNKMQDVPSCRVSFLAMPDETEQMKMKMKIQKQKR